jgi:hypothetical protein
MVELRGWETWVVKGTIQLVSEQLVHYKLVSEQLVHYNTEMEFLDISSLGATYRYAIKIVQKLKQKTRQFGPGNPSQQNLGKGGPKPQNKG